ncbi:TnsD family Tn7-like transposition protein [Alicyclobacillus sp. SO9]|uniref:TnsD family Tn7-like transposition protein n=1 Tax=Alicyclobacillus sp. SO9 TaxID=2665646 RepID=UPI0018E7F60B|nr:TnsD family Tn7-like transposition protein [Alicyclobacillus sp. SO9]QQE78395.1 TnsD family transposase [Alicyclobacillus sp. SO9]
MLRIYPDELLVGLIARYHIYSGHSSFKESVRKAFGLEGVRPSVHLPSHLCRLEQQGHFDKSAEALIMENTLFPYYCSFLHPRMAERVKQDMLHDGNLSVYLESGLVASRVPLGLQMVWCPLCVEDDIQTYGEPYLHRVHHIPGVKVCPKHSVKLRSKCPHCDSAPYQRGIQEFPYPLTVCTCGHSLLVPERNNDPLLARLASDSQFILNNTAPWDSLEFLRERYINALYKMDLATPKGSIRQAALYERFMRQFPQAFWTEVGVGAPIKDNEWSWLRELTRKPKKALHPMLHILLIEFLSEDAPRFFSRSRFTPFGRGPWPCLNKAADHHMQNVVEDLTITICSDTRRPVGTFRCNCGFTYSRRGPDRREEDRIRFGRIKEFGHVWENKLQTLISQEGWSLRGLARELGTDPKVITIRLNEQIVPPENLESTVVSQLELRRQRFTSIMYGNPSLSRTQLRHMDNRDYQWLLRHDRQWLEQMLPRPLTNVATNRPRVDWRARDLAMSHVVEKTVQQIIDEREKPVRVTVGRIGRVCGKKSMLEKCLSKLPLTQQVLDDHMETVADFQKRRIRRAVSYLLGQGEPVAEWKVMRLAGLSNPMDQGVQKCLREAVDLACPTQVGNVPRGEFHELD